MNKALRQTLKSTTVFYIAAIFGAINRLFLLTEFLSPEQIGFLDVFMSLAVILVSFSNFGLYSALQKFHQEYKEKNQYKVYYTRIFLYVLVGFLLVITLFLSVKANILDIYKNEIFLKDYYYLIPILVFAFLLRNFFNTISTIEKNTTVPAITNDLWIKLSSTTLLLLIGFKFIDFNTYIIVFVGLQFVALFIIYFYIKKSISFSFKYRDSNTSSLNLNSTFKYSFYTVLTGLSFYIIQFADINMLAMYKNLNSSGIYSVAFFIGAAIEMPKRALSSISFPMISSYFENNEINKIDSLYKKSSLNQGLIALFFYLLLYVNITELFSIMPNSTIYILGKNVALIIGASKVIDMFMGVNGQVLYASKYYKYNFYTTLFLVGLTILTNYILIPIYGLNGAAFATILTITINNLVMFVLVKKKIGLNPFTKKSILPLILFSFLILVDHFMPSFVFTEGILNNILNIFIKSIIFGGLFLFISYKIKISEDVNNLINLSINKIQRK